MTITQLIEKIVAMWPKAFDSPGKLDAWSEAYREQLGHLRSEVLSEAWRRTMQSYSQKTPPLPADIFRNIPDERAPLLAAVGAHKSMGDMAKHTPDIISDLLTDWWQNFGAWVDQKMTELGIEEERRPAVLWSLRDALRTIARFQAQEIYWRGGDRVIDLDCNNGAYRPRFDASWHWGKKKPAVGRRAGLGDIAHQIIQQGMTVKAEVLPPPE